MKATCLENFQMVTKIYRRRMMQQQRYRQSLTANLLTGQGSSITPNETISINQPTLSTTVPNSNIIEQAISIDSDTLINDVLHSTQSTVVSLNETQTSDSIDTPPLTPQRRSGRTQRLPVRYREEDQNTSNIDRRSTRNTSSRRQRPDESEENEERNPQRLRLALPGVPTTTDNPSDPVDVNLVFANAHGVDAIDIGELSEKCHYCNALFFKAERNTHKMYTKCCADGKVRLNSNHQLTPLMYSLLTGTHPKSSHFITNSLYYNNAFAMCSMGAKSEILARGGPLVIKLNGIVMHNTSWIQPRNDEPHRYAQVYVLDPQQAVQNRLSRCPILDSTLVEELELDLRNHNRLVNTYSFLKDVYDRALENNENVQSLTMLMRDERDLDMGRFTAPVINDIAVVFRANEGFQKDPMDLLIHQSNGRLIRVRETHPLLNALTYPMLYSTGDEGYKQGQEIFTAHLSRTYIRKKLTMHMYYSYMIAIRRHPTSTSPIGFNPLLSAGPLTQLFLIDVDQRCIKDRLEFLKQNQDKLFAVRYKDLQRAVRYRFDSTHIPGTQVVLPSSFPGSPRNLQQLYMDAMAMVAKYGKPDLFITITCNPAWPEITRSLEPGQSVNNRPDLVARVFQMRLERFLNDIDKKRHFGEVIGFTYTVEFQKRGLPHAHILLILSEQSKLRTRDHVDKFVVAEMPDPLLFPNLFQAVSSFNTHKCKPGRCKPDANSECERGFPKPYSDETDVMTDSFPLYRRRNNELPEFEGRTIDNRYVVPYNPKLTMRHRAHINVEVCSSINSVKYLYKYIFKGYDAALLTFVDDADGHQIVNMDEIKAFQEARFVSPPEACYRHFDFPMHNISHDVIRLPVHLPNEQLLIINPDRPLEPHLLDATTKLMDFFRLNREDHSARTLTYNQIPYHYTWSKRWQKRINKTKLISRMHNVAPLDRERYAMRVLLLHRTDVRSFEDLRKGINDEIKETFAEAAIDHGLLDNDDEWINCLLEAQAYKMPIPLRILFIEICTVCNATDCPSLWDQFKDSLSEDFLHAGHEPSVAYQLALLEIQKTFRSITPSGDFRSLRLPLNPAFRPPMVDDRNRAHRILESQRLSLQYSTSLNESQRLAYDSIMEAMRDETLERFFYIDGPGGSGKTYLYNTLLHSVRAQGGTFISVAWTGVAAMLLLDGQTSHTGFRLPLRIDETTSLHQDRSSQVWKRIESASIIIWDEISLVPRYALDSVDRLCRNVTGIDKPFGNKLFVVGGDFRQCLPIMRNAHRSAIVELSVKFARSWPSAIKLSLTQNMRAPGAEFNNWLLQVGEGTQGNKVSIQSDMLTNEQDLIDFTFGRTLSISEQLIRRELRNDNNTDLLQDFCESAILCAKNNDTFELNDKILNIQPGQLSTYNSIDKVNSDETGAHTMFPVEFLNTITPSGFPQHKLTVKRGTPVILLRNMSIHHKLTNGTRMIIKDVHRHSLVCKVVMKGKLTNQIVFLPRIDFDSNGSDTPIPFRRRQFPVRVAFAMTINKSQGQTLGRVGLALRSPCFSHGQLYVALSRVRSRENVKIFIPDHHGNECTIDNVVFREIFS